ncbi:MAG: hypothetical protein ACRDZO_27985 [Egibacteraceae bacterium]
MTRPLDRLAADLGRVLDEHTPDVSVPDLAVSYDDEAIAGVIEVSRAIHRVRQKVQEIAGGYAGDDPPLPLVGRLPEGTGGAELFTPGLPLS